MFAKRMLFVCFVVVLGLAYSPLSAQEEAYFPTIEWRISTPEAQGMDSAELANFYAQFSQDHFNLDSLLVIRHGYVVAEAYTPLMGQSTQQETYSVSKSVIGALIGILLHDGYLKTVETPVLSLFPDRTVQNVDENKQAMTVRHLLTMSSGLACDDIFGVTNTPVVILSREDGLQYALDLPMGSSPGSEFHYCNAGTYILSGIITNLTGMSAVDFATENLFEPLGITDYAWASSPEGITLGFAGLQVTTRDMAKIGYLFLNDGLWEGKQIIPADYAHASLAAQISPGWPDMSYGYQWWHGDSINTAFALGRGGQYILLAPDKDLIVVMTSSMIENIRPALQGYPLNYAAAALTTADNPLPQNATAQTQFEDQIARIESAPVTTAEPMPEITAQVSDQTYNLAPLALPADGIVGYVQPVNITGVRFTFTDSTQTEVTFTTAEGLSWTAPIGMDGRYAASEGPLGMVGIRGEWHTQTEFTMYIHYVGEIWNVRLDASFIPGGIQIRETDVTDGYSAVTNGLAAQ